MKEVSVNVCYTESDSYFTRFCNHAMADIYDRIGMFFAELFLSIHKKCMVLWYTLFILNKNGREMIALLKLIKAKPSS